MKQQNKKWIDEVWKNKWTHNVAGILFFIDIIRTSKYYPGWVEYIAFLIGLFLGAYSLAIIIMTIRWLIIRKKK